jgi:hypothetical protein
MSPSLFPRMTELKTVDRDDGCEAMLDLTRFGPFELEESEKDFPLESMKIIDGWGKSAPYSIYFQTSLPYHVYYSYTIITLYPITLI